MTLQLWVSLMGAGGFTVLLWFLQWIAGRGERKTKAVAAAAAAVKAEAEKIAAQAKADAEKATTEAEAKAKAVEVEIKQKQYVEDRTVALATTLREELRTYNLDLKEDNAELRKRVRQTELDAESTKTQLAGVVKENETLRRENLDLASKNGALEMQVKMQGQEIIELRAEVKKLQADRLTLMDEMRKEKMTIPPLSA